MVMKRSSTSRKLGLEQFESRQMMAGNVSVAFSGNDLLITGDGESNGVQISQARTSLGAPILGTYFISGLTAGGSGTTINGQASVIVRNANDDVLVNLGRGDDRFNTGPGSATARHFFANHLTVNLGEGNNTTNLNNISVFDDVTVTSGTGSDSVFVRGLVGNSTSHPDANLTINTGEGVDSVSVVNYLVRGDISIDTGLGNTIDGVLVSTGTVGDDVTIRTHDGDDTVNINLTTVLDDVTVDTAGGKDKFFMSDSDCDELFAFLGSQDDTANFSHASGRRATLSGGSGVDTLTRVDFEFPDSSISGF